MAIRQLPNARQQYFDGSGNPLAGGKVYTYEVGTSTPKATYSDSNGATPNSNPVILDSRGEAEIWYDGTYKIKLTDSNDVEIYSQDNYGAGATATLSGNYNLVNNGAFENDTDGDGTPDGWDVFTFSGGTFELDTSTQQAGSQSAKFTNTGSGGGHLTASDFVPVAGGQTLSWSFWINTNNASIGMKVGVRWFDDGESLLSESAVYDSTSNPTSWTQQSGSVDAPANARFAKVRLYGGTGSVSASGWFDDVRLLSFTHVDANTVSATTVNGTTVNQDGNAALDESDLVANGGTVPGDYQREVVELGGDFDAGEEVICLRSGGMVMIMGIGALTHPNDSTITSNGDVIPEAFRPTSGTGLPTNTFFTSSDGNRVASITGTWGLRVQNFDNSGTAFNSTSTGAPPFISYPL